jgi:hypothetical protein
MNLVKHVLVLATGAAFGVVAVLSCSDDSPRHSDAATCDCPTSEPPLVGRIIVQDDIQTLEPVGGPDNGSGVAGIGCPPGTQLLSGSCSTTSMSLSDITLRESGVPNGPTSGWRCSFHNNTTSPIQIKATVVCLKPAS